MTCKKTARRRPFGQKVGGAPAARPDSARKFYRPDGEPAMKNPLIYFPVWLGLVLLLFFLAAFDLLPMQGRVADAAFARD